VKHMPSIISRQFGSIEYSEQDVFDFPTGLPGFESRRHFLCLERPALRPVVFLQSLEDPELCFVTIPATAVDPQYQLAISTDDLEVLGTATELQQNAVSSLACLAIVCLPTDGAPTANLLGPVVLSRETRRGVQAVRGDRRYSALTPIHAAQEESQPLAEDHALHVNGVTEA
jgi:flagellar assembly factor FliW